MTDYHRQFGFESQHDVDFRFDLRIGDFAFQWIANGFCRADNQRSVGRCYCRFSSQIHHRRSWENNGALIDLWLQEFVTVFLISALRVSMLREWWNYMYCVDSGVHLVGFGIDGDQNVLVVQCHSWCRDFFPIKRRFVPLVDCHRPTTKCGQIIGQRFKTDILDVS